ncbi:hypothetical protein [Frondihabitans sp. PhB188]|uniref:hypothetical protein n=1 Tax=Frondihabitans sp. PhB188 TaxID=2485200 RepID=UPI000F47C669|nr:hypothetical protein [Frondihabitans sp. PhB188]
MSLYVRHASAMPARIEVYPKRRRTLVVDVFAATPTRRDEPTAPDVCYADFFVDAAGLIAS